MSKNILKNKRSCVFILLFVLGTSVWLGGCDTAYKYDITDGIQPKNGVVHVLRMTDHDFGFDRRLFALKAIEEGIDELSQFNKTE